MESQPISRNVYTDLTRQIRTLQKQGSISAQAINQFKVSLVGNAGGTSISFTLMASANIRKISLIRNTSSNRNGATELTEWSAPFTDGTPFNYVDSDPSIQGKATYYWLVLRNDQPAQQTFVGPASTLVFGNSATPPAIVAFDASLSAGANGIQKCNVSFVAPTTSFGSVQIQIAGYQGNPNYVAIAQSSGEPFSFNLKQTGEAITLKAITFSSSGQSFATTGPTKALTLNGAETVPASIIVASVQELTSGVQISFTAGAETDIVNWQIWRAVRNAGFGAASNIGTVAPTGAATYTFLDSNGLTGRYEWYVVAVGPAGSSAASTAVTNLTLNTSADLPPNVPQNNTNFATVDSIDNGTNDTIRIYGAAGGVGTSWTRPTGYGTETYPPLSQAGFARITKYFVVYDKLNLVYQILTTFPATLPDNFIWVGSTTTVAAGGTGGTPGGGGTSGGGGGRPSPL